MDINKVKEAIRQMSDLDELKLFNEKYKNESDKEYFKLQREFLLAGIPQIYWSIEWDNCHIEKELKEFVKLYCNHFKEALESGQGFIFTGQNGVGKTSLSCLIAKEAIRQGYTSFYMPISKIIDIISKGYDDNDKKENLNMIIEGVHILILDDVGKTYLGVKNQLSTMVNLKLDSLFRERINRSLITLGSTNYTEQELKSVCGDSVLSVIYGSCKIVEVKGKDFRRIQGQKFWSKLEGNKK